MLATRNPLTFIFVSDKIFCNNFTVHTFVLVKINHFG